MKYLFLLLLIPILCYSQPTTCFAGVGSVGVTSGCPCNPAQSPCVQAYIGDVNTALNAAYATLTSKRQNAIPSGMALITAAPVYFEADPLGCQNSTPNSCIFANATLENQLIDTAVAQTGSTYIDINIDPVPYLTSAEYTGSCTPVHLAQATYLLTVYDAMFAHIKAKGLKIRLAPEPGFLWAINNPGGACSLKASTMTVTQQDNAYGPTLAAIVAHLNTNGIAITDLTVNHEPNGLWNSITGQVFSTADWTTMIQQLSPYVTGAAGGSGIQIGSGFTFGDTAYPPVVAANVNSSGTVMNFGGIDVYFSQAPGTWVTELASYGTMCSQFLGATPAMACKTNEAGHWGHCPSAGSGCGLSVQYEGCGWIGLQTYNVNNAFFQLLPLFVSSVGATYVSQYQTQPISIFQSAPLLGACLITTPTGYTAQVLTNAATVPSAAGFGWKSGVTFGQLSMQGNLATSGKVKIP